MAKKRKRKDNKVLKGVKARNQVQPKQEVQQYGPIRQKLEDLHLFTPILIMSILGALIGFAAGINQIVMPESLNIGQELIWLGATVGDLQPNWNLASPLALGGALIGFGLAYSLMLRAGAAMTAWFVAVGIGLVCLDYGLGPWSLVAAGTQLILMVRALEFSGLTVAQELATEA